MQQIKDACTRYRSPDLQIKKALASSTASPNLDILYVDKNNTPDIWLANSQMMKTIVDEDNGRSIIKTVLLLPNQASFDKTMYTTPNPMSPQFIYECFFRIFSRKNHCLANDNKPKAVEVVFKYMKLFDNVDFDDDESLSKYFDFSLSIDFVNYLE
jgi:hypothetical protein